MRINDTLQGTCPVHGVLTNAHYTAGSPTVKANGIAVVRIGDLGVADCGHQIKANTASSVLKADGIAVTRVGDKAKFWINDALVGELTALAGSPTVDSN